MAKKNKDSMTIEQLIAIADSAYPDNMIQQAFDAQKKNKGRKRVTIGDGLAEFIARELTETFDSTASRLAQLQEASRCMYTAQREVFSVSDRLARELSDVAVAKARR